MSNFKRQVAVVTGASSGVGYAAAQRLAAHNYRVIALGRDPLRIAEKRAQLEAAIPGNSVTWIRADFASLAEVERAAQEIAGQTDRVDLLVNNAGGHLDRRIVTIDGLEATFAINHLAPFLLTARLMQQLRAAETAQMIAVSSIGHSMIDDMAWDDLMLEREFDPFKAYCQSKLANVLFTREFARRNPGMIASAVHPGMVASRFPLSAGPQVVAHYRAAEQSGQTVTEEEGADTIVWLALHPDQALPSGGYFAERQRIDPSPSAQSDEAARRLWAISEALTNLT